MRVGGETTTEREYRIAAQDRERGCTSEVLLLESIDDLLALAAAPDRA